MSSVQSTTTTQTNKNTVAYRAESVKRTINMLALKPLPLSSPQNVDQSSCPYYSRNFERGSVSTPLSLCASLSKPLPDPQGRPLSLSKPSQTHREDLSLSPNPPRPTGPTDISLSRCAPNPSETHKAGWQLSTCKVRGGIIDSRPPGPEEASWTCLSVPVGLWPGSFWA
jgi:hypothetical protein